MDESAAPTLDDAAQAKAAKARARARARARRPKTRRMVSLRVPIVLIVRWKRGALALGVTQGELACQALSAYLDYVEPRVQRVIEARGS